MKKIILFITVCAIAITSIIYRTNQSRAVPQNLLTGWNNIKQSSIKRDVRYLSSDALQGRLSLSSGDNKSVQWIAKQFKTAGLKPANGDSFLQAVPLIEYQPDSDHNYIATKTAQGTKRWQKPDAYIAFPKKLNLTGNVVFAGYGITAPALNYDDYKDINVKGKIVLVFEHEPQETYPHSVFNGVANTVYATKEQKVLNAQKHGAIAVLIAPEPNRTHPSNQERYRRVGGSTTRQTPLPKQVLVNDEIHIPGIVISDQLSTAITNGKISLTKRQAAIDASLQPQSQALPDLQLTIHNRNLSVKKGTSYNVAGLLNGSDPSLKNETIIISAHHDHDGTYHQKIWHGADDNASGTAGVVALANAMAKNANTRDGLKPKRSILFIVFAAEERGLLGAFYMAKHPLRPLATTRAMINFDMIGRNEQRSKQTDGLIDIPRDTTNRLNLIGAHYSPDYDRLVVKQNQIVGLDLDHRFDEDHALNIFFRSDQFPFVLQHVPAFWWFTGFHPDYHHVTDTADKINYSKMQRILQLSYLSAYAFSNQRSTPRFIVNP